MCHIHIPLSIEATFKTDRIVINIKIIHDPGASPIDRCRSRVNRNTNIRWDCKWAKSWVQLNWGDILCQRREDRLKEMFIGSRIVSVEDFGWVMSVHLERIAHFNKCRFEFSM